jgi:MarR family transcriptional regulator, organic hydroperoxide resistance regulator
MICNKRIRESRSPDYHSAAIMSSVDKLDPHTKTQVGKLPRAPLTPPESDADGLGSVLEFMRLVWGLHHALQSRSKRMEQSLGVTGPQRLVIRVIGRYPQVAAGRLAATLKVHPSTLTGILRRLESKGFVRRSDDSHDRRRALFQLTKLGKELDTVKAGTVEAAARRALRGIPAERLEITATLLTKLAEELERDDA